MSADNARHRIRFRPGLRLSVFVVVFLPLVSGLAAWQWGKAGEAERFEAQLEAMAAEPPARLSQAQVEGAAADLQPVSVEGRFLQAPWVWLDNRTWRGRAGYELLVPFADDSLAGQRVLVNLGWVQGGVDRSELPEVELPTSRMVLSGQLAPLRPPAPVFGEVLDRVDGGLRVQRLELELLAEALEMELHPRVLVADAAQPGVQTWNFRAMRMTSDRHRGYALQWVGLGLVLLVGWCFASFRRDPA